MTTYTDASPCWEYQAPNTICTTCLTDGRLVTTCQPPAQCGNCHPCNLTLTDLALHVDTDQGDSVDVALNYNGIIGTGMSAYYQWTSDCAPTPLWGATGHGKGEIMVVQCTVTSLLTTYQEYLYSTVACAGGRALGVLWGDGHVPIPICTCNPLNLFMEAGDPGFERYYTISGGGGCVQTCPAFPCDLPVGDLFFSWPAVLASGPLTYNCGIPCQWSTAPFDSGLLEIRIVPSGGSGNTAYEIWQNNGIGFTLFRQITIGPTGVVSSTGGMTLVSYSCSPISIVIQDSGSNFTITV